MTAFVFPGQGAQFAGMGKDLSENFPVARQIFAEADDALNEHLSRLCFEGPEEDLKLTANTQPAILTHSIAALHVLQQETGLSPQVAAGHSLGEYSALVCAGALSFADAVKTVRKRGQFMQEAVPVGEGAMAAILGLDNDVLQKICSSAAQGEVVAPANFNSTGQIVIAGHSAAVNRACELAKERGAKRALPLPVSAPFHCALMQPAADRLAEVLAQLAVGDMLCPVVSNVEATPNQESSRVVELLVRQVCAPVQWTDSVQTMVDLGVSRFVELGPGKTLSGLIKRLASDAELQNVEDCDSLKKIQ
jgi:[acyl-carrier-protein] S-malonyltransferase